MSGLLLEELESNLEFQEWVPYPRSTPNGPRFLPQTLIPFQKLESKRRKVGYFLQNTLLLKVEESSQIVCSHSEPIHVVAISFCRFWDQISCDLSIIALISFTPDNIVASDSVKVDWVQALSKFQSCVLCCNIHFLISMRFCWASMSSYVDSILAKHS